MKATRSPQWVDKGTYKEPIDGDNIRVPRLEVDNATTYVDKDGSDNLTLTDAVTGTKTLAQLVAGGIDTSGTPVDNDYAKFTDADTVEGRSYAEVRSDLSLGVAGINVETLSGAKTLTAGTDKIYQYLDEGGDNRIITLDTASATAGDRFVIRHNGAYNDTKYLEVKQAAVVLDQIFAGNIKEFIFDGTNWISRGIGTGDSDNKDNQVAIGHQASAYNVGIAIGYNAQGYSFGVAAGQDSLGYDYGVGIGKQADGHTHGAAVGANADGSTNGVGIGDAAAGANYGVGVGFQTDTNDKKYSIALGYYSECERVGETSININGDDTDQENNVVQGRWCADTTDATPAEIFLGEQANERFTIRASSALAFTMKVVARDNVAGHVAMYTFEGLIKRDASNNTALLVVNKTIIHEDDATWDVAVTADDTNEALIITVTGDGANITQWAAVMDGVETHF